MALGIGLSSAHAAAPLFIPTDISGLALWLKHNIGHTSENDETTAAGDIDDDDRIKQWDDQSGNNNHAAQSTAADMPRYVSSSGALKFVNTLKWFDLTSAISINASADFSVFMRIEFSAIEQDALIGDSSTDFWRLHSNSTFRTKIGGSTQNNWAEASDTVATDTEYIISLVRSNGSTGTLNVYIYGGDYTTEKDWDSSEGATDADAFTISNIGAEADDTNEFDGLLKDVLIYNGTALTSSQRTDVYNYLNSQS